MPEAEFIEHVAVMDGDVADDKVGLNDKAEHVLADVAGLDDLAGCSSAEPGIVQRWGNQLVVNALEVNLRARGVLLFAKRPDDKCSLHLQTSLLSTPSPYVAP